MTIFQVVLYSGCWIERIGIILEKRIIRDNTTLRIGNSYCRSYIQLDADGRLRTAGIIGITDQIAIVGPDSQTSRINRNLNILIGPGRYGTVVRIFYQPGSIPATGSVNPER